MNSILWRVDLECTFSFYIKAKVSCWDLFISYTCKCVCGCVYLPGQAGTFMPLDKGVQVHLVLGKVYPLRVK